MAQTYKLSGPITDPLLAEKLVRSTIAYLGAGMTTMMIPQLKGVVPVKTGNLRDSMFIKIEAKTITIGFKPEGYYWPYQRGLTKRMRNVWARGLNSLIPWAWQRAIADNLPPI